MPVPACHPPRVPDDDPRALMCTTPQDNSETRAPVTAATPASTPLDAAAISAEARSAGVRTPRLPEVPADDDGAEKGEKAQAQEKARAAAVPPPPSAEPAKKKGGEEDEFEALAKRFEALKKR